MGLITGMDYRNGRLSVALGTLNAFIYTEIIFEVKDLVRIRLVSSKYSLFLHYPLVQSSTKAQRDFLSCFNLYKEPSFTHVYIVFHSATMLMLGPSTFLEDEDEEGASSLNKQYWKYR